MAGAWAQMWRLGKTSGTLPGFPVMTFRSPVDRLVEMYSGAVGGGETGPLAAAVESRKKKSAGSTFSEWVEERKKLSADEVYDIEAESQGLVLPAPVAISAGGPLPAYSVEERETEPETLFMDLYRQAGISGVEVERLPEGGMVIPTPWEHAARLVEQSKTEPAKYLQEEFYGGGYEGEITIPDALAESLKGTFPPGYGLITTFAGENRLVPLERIEESMAEEAAAQLDAEEGLQSDVELEELEGVFREEWGP